MQGIIKRKQLLKTGHTFFANLRQATLGPSHVRLFATPWTVAHQALQSMGGGGRRLPFPSPGDLPDPGIKPGSPAWQADALPSEPPGKLESPIINQPP